MLRKEIIYLSANYFNSQLLVADGALACDEINPANLLKILQGCLRIRPVW